MGKHDRTPSAVFAEPARGNIAWADIEAMFRHLGADVTEGRGSRVRVALADIRAVFHRPHPRSEAAKPVVRSVRRFLQEAGVQL